MKIRLPYLLPPELMSYDLTTLAYFDCYLVVTIIVMFFRPMKIIIMLGPMTKVIMVVILDWNIEW